MRCSTAATGRASLTKACMRTMSAQATASWTYRAPLWIIKRSTSAAIIRAISTRCSWKRSMRLMRPLTFRSSTPMTTATSTACTSISPALTRGGAVPGGARSGRCSSRPRPRCASVPGTVGACGTRACWPRTAPGTWRPPRLSMKRDMCSAFPTCIAIEGPRRMRSSVPGA